MFGKNQQQLTPEQLAAIRAASTRQNASSRWANAFVMSGLVAFVGSVYFYTANMGQQMGDLDDLDIPPKATK